MVQKHKDWGLDFQDLVVRTNKKWSKQTNKKTNKKKSNAFCSISLYVLVHLKVCYGMYYICAKTD